MVEKLLSTMDAGDYISILACLISVIAAVISIVMYNLEKKGYKLQLKEYRDGLANFDFEIMDCFIRDDKEDEKIQYWLNLLITNLSDKQTSIVDYTLKLECLENLLYRPEFAHSKNEEKADVKYLSSPENINSHNSIRGWCVFELPRSTYQKLSIESYIVNLKDIHYREIAKKAIYMREEIINYEI